MIPPDSTRPIRLAFGITDLDVGGAERALVEIVTRLDGETWEPAVFCLASRGELAERFEGVGIPVTSFGARGWWDWRIVGRFAAALRDWRPALLQTFLFHANVVGRLAGRRAGVGRIVSGVRVADRRGAWRHWVDRWTASRADHHVCVSRAVAAFTEERTGIPPDRISVIPNGVDFERFAAAEPADLTALGVPAEAPVVLFVGRLDPQKDPLTLLDAFEEVNSANVDAHLVLVGEGVLRDRIERRIASSANGRRMHLLGRREDVPALMRAATMLVLPSRFEGMPNVVLEAMAAGLPIVCTDVEGVAEVTQCGDAVDLVSAGDMEALAAAINSLLRDPEQRLQMSSASQDIVEKRFTWESPVSQYDQLYRRLLGIDTESTAGESSSEVS